MTTANPLVVGPIDTSSPLSGTMLLESLSDLTRALDSGSWLDIALSGLSTALDTAAAIMDPLGQLLAAGLGWLMEHLQPLKGWLNQLTGDPGAVAGFAATWQNIATHTANAAEGYARIVAADLEGMAGEGVEAYARYAQDFANHLDAVSGSASAVASSLQVAGTIVQVVHDVVRDALAEIVGAAISWAAQIVLTVGLGTPWVVSQVATRVSSLATRVGGKVTALINSSKSLSNLIDAMKRALSNLAQGLRGARPGSMHAPNTPRLPSTTPRTALPDISDLEHLMRKAYGPTGELVDPASLRSWAEQVAVRHPSLTPDEVLDVHWYTTNQGYETMNRAMRGLDTMTPDVRARVDSAMSGLSKLPQYDGVTFRGTNLPDEVLANYVPGNTVRDGAFWSTSTKPSVAEQFRLGQPGGPPGNAFITIEGGHSGVDVAALSYYGHEAEILFPGGHPYEVLSVIRNPRGFFEILLRDIG